MVRVHGTDKGLAVTSDCTPRYVQNDPYEGGKQAVAEAWRNLTAVGSRPIAITDNLNFGNPQRPEIMGQIVRAIDGMAEACRALDFPVVSGNVSLYNETNGVAIPPTPTVGAVGLLTNYDVVTGFSTMAEGDTLVLIGETVGELGASIYLREVLGREDGAPPPVDLALERKTGDFVRDLIETGRLTCVHDLSDGGLIGAAADMALASDIGVELDATSAAHAHIFLFGEDQGRYLVAVPNPVEIIAAAQEAGLHASVVGHAAGRGFRLGRSVPLAAGASARNARKLDAELDRELNGVPPDARPADHRRRYPGPDRLWAGRRQDRCDRKGGYRSRGGRPCRRYGRVRVTRRSPPPKPPCTPRWPPRPAIRSMPSYIAKMIAHHRGAVAMADVALAQSQDPAILRMAQTVKDTQTAEIAEMQAWEPAPASPPPAPAATTTPASPEAAAN